MTGTAMVEIQCPHCKRDVELEDGVFGLFDCPHCNNEFEFEDDSTNINISYRPKKGVTILLVFSFLFAIGAGIIYYDTSTSTSEYEGCDNCSWEESIGDGIGQGAAEAAAEELQDVLSQMCLILSGVLLLVAIVNYVIQQNKRPR
jgi:hypothetical protein